MSTRKTVSNLRSRIFNWQFVSSPHPLAEDHVVELSFLHLMVLDTYALSLLKRTFYRAKLGGFFGFGTDGTREEEKMA